MSETVLEEKLDGEPEAVPNQYVGMPGWGEGAPAPSPNSARPQAGKTMNPCCCCKLRTNCMIIAGVIVFFSLHVFYTIKVNENNNCKKNVHDDACYAQTMYKVLAAFYIIFCWLAALLLLGAIFARQAFVALGSMVFVILAVLEYAIMNLYYIIHIESIKIHTKEGSGKKNEGEDFWILLARLVYGLLIIFLDLLFLYFALCIYAFFLQLRAGTDLDPLKKDKAGPEGLEEGQQGPPPVYYSQPGSNPYMNAAPPPAFYGPQETTSSAAPLN